MEDYGQYFLFFFPIVGLCLLVWGIMWRSRVKEKLQSYASVEGTIIGTEVNTDGDSTTYHPVIEYIVYGKTYSFKSSVGYGRKQEEGSSLEVMYDPGKPSSAFALKGCFFASTVLILLGSSFFFFGSLAGYVIYVNM